MDTAAVDYDMTNERCFSECNEISNHNSGAVEVRRTSYSDQQEGDPQNGDPQEYVGFAFDYGKYPKILAVHSGLSQHRPPPIDPLAQKFDSHDWKQGRREEGYFGSPSSMPANMAAQGPHILSRLPSLPFHPTDNIQHLRRSHIDRRQIPPKFFPRQCSHVFHNGRPRFAPTVHFDGNIARVDSSFNQHSTRNWCLSARNHAAQGSFKRSCGGESFSENIDEPVAKVQRVSYRVADPWLRYPYRHGSDALFRGTMSSEAHPVQYRSPCGPTVMAPVTPFGGQPPQFLSLDAIPSVKIRSAFPYYERLPDGDNDGVQMARSCSSEADSMGNPHGYGKFLDLSTGRLQDQASKEHGNAAEKKRLPDHWMDQGFFSRLLLHENRHDLLQTLKAAALLSRNLLLFAVNRLLSEKVVENALLVLDNLKRSDLTEIVKEKILSVIQEVIWKHPPKYELWSDLTVDRKEPCSCERISDLHGVSGGEVCSKAINCQFEDENRSSGSASDQKRSEKVDARLLENLDDDDNICNSNEDRLKRTPRQGDDSNDTLIPRGWKSLAEDEKKQLRDGWKNGTSSPGCISKSATSRSKYSVDGAHLVDVVATTSSGFIKKEESELLTEIFDGNCCLGKNQVRTSGPCHLDPKAAENLHVKSANIDVVSKVFPVEDELIQVMEDTQCYSKEEPLSEMEALEEYNEMNSDHYSPSSCLVFHEIDIIDNSEL